MCCISATSATNNHERWQQVKEHKQQWISFAGKRNQEKMKVSS